MSAGAEPLAFDVPLRLVVVGDGYSAGDSTAAPNRDSWPAQLQQISRQTDIPIRLVQNLATPGRASDEVLADQLPLVKGYDPDLVVVQVGINDIVITETPLDEYGTNLAAIFDGLREQLPADRIYALTTPDHRLTAVGRALGGTVAVDDINAVLDDVARERDIVVIDVAELYSLVAGDPSFVVDGGPHPSAHQYAGWAELIGQRINHTLVANEP